MHCGESRELGLGRGDRDSMPFDYEKTIAQMPHQPGVYLMKDASEHVVYVGKAKDLAKRVKQYFTGHDDRSFVASLDKILSRIDVIITSTEREALILEAGLIKRYMPRFNVVIADRYARRMAARRICEAAKERWSALFWPIPERASVPSQSKRRQSLF